MGREVHILDGADVPMKASAMAPITADALPVSRRDAAIVPLACTGAAEAPRWLSPDEGERLLTARPERNLLPTALEQQLDLTLPALAKLRAALEPVAEERAGAQREAHERVRAATRAKGRVAVEPVLPVDLLGVYVLLPRLV